jgi:uncharacterized protein (DUF58 family)
MVTTRGWVLVGAAVLSALAGRILGIAELFGLAVGALTLVVGARLYVLRGPGLLFVTARATPMAAHVGDVAQLEIVVLNRGVTRSPTVLLRPSRPRRAAPDQIRIADVAVPQLEPGVSARLTVALDTSRRGVFELSGLDALLEDPVGLASRRSTVGGPARLTVFPRIDPLDDLVPFAGFNPRFELTRSTVTRLSSGLSTVRRYDDGDDLRLVHWKTTARVGELMVREGGDPESPESRSTTVVLDTRGTVHTDATFELAVGVATSVLGSGFAVGSTARLVTTGGIDVRAANDPRHFEELLYELATVHPGKETNVRSAVQLVVGDEAPGVLVVVTAERLDEGLEDLISLHPVGHAIVVLTGLSPVPPRGLSGVHVVCVPPGAALRPAWAASLDPAKAGPPVAPVSGPRAAVAGQEAVEAGAGGARR